MTMDVGRCQRLAFVVAWKSCSGKDLFVVADILMDHFLRFELLDGAPPACRGEEAVPLAVGEELDGVFRHSSVRDSNSCANYYFTNSYSTGQYADYKPNINESINNPKIFNTN